MDQIRIGIVCMLMLLPGTALAGASCDDMPSGWVHLDAANGQNVICPGKQINVYMVSRAQGDAWVEAGLRYDCGKPEDSKQVRYRYDHASTSQVPFYSYPAMACMDQKIEALERQLAAMQMRMQRR